MSDKDREHYKAKAASSRSLGTAVSPSAVVPFNPSQHRVPSTPKPSPIPPLLRARPTQFQTPPNSGGAYVVSGSTWGGLGPPASTPTPRSAAATAMASSPLLRVLAVSSSSRPNSAASARGQPKVKTEVLPQTTSRGAKRKVMEVIDLTAQRMTDCP